METVSGVVEAVRKDSKGLMINDVWYSSYNPMSSDVVKGASVVFNYVEKGPYKNIKGAVRVDSKPSASAGKSVGKTWDNTGVEVGHASNLAMRIMEQRIAVGTDIEVGSTDYWKQFSKDTIDVYKLMSGIKDKIRGGAVETKAETLDKGPKTVAHKDEEVEDLF